MAEFETGHGWVTPRADGAKARCGGPAICSPCAREQASQQAQQAGDEQALVDTLTDATMAGVRLATTKIAAAIRRQRQPCVVHRWPPNPSLHCVPCARDAAYVHAAEIAESGRIEERHGG